MENNKLNVEHKLNILQWHARNCKDGHLQPWKERLAKALSVKPSAVSKLFKTAYKFTKNTPIRKALDELTDGALINAIGLLPRSEGPNRATVPTNLGSISDEYHHAFIARDCGLALNDAGEKSAVIYEEKKRQLEQRWHLNEVALIRAASSEQESEGLISVPLFAKEECQITEVFNSLSSTPPSESGCPAMVVYASPHSGITYLLYQLLPRQPKFKACYPGGVLHLHLDALERLAEIGREAGKGLFGEVDARIMTAVRNKGWAEVVAEELVRAQRLLIVHGASSALNDSDKTASNFLSGVAKSIEKLTKSSGALQVRCTRLLLVAWDRNQFQGLNQKVKKLDFNCEIESGESAFSYFSDCVEYYRLLRAQTRGEHGPPFVKPGNNTLKRIRLHYMEIADSGFTPVPASVRFRAFCATDVYAANPFDPTLGIWNRLDKQLRQCVPEITYSLGDIQNFVRGLKRAGRRKELEALRLGSTALFYFSSNMLKQLNELELTTLTFDDLPEVVNNSVGNILRLGDGGSKLTVPLLVRALIQDDWMQFDLNGRSKVHEAIAAILENIASDRNPSSEAADELPYSLPWKNRQLVFALEAARHYMRASFKKQDSEAARLCEQARRIFESYLEHGTFSFSQLPTVQSRPAGTLSRSFGLDGLKYEALCLLSEDNYGTIAPRGINDDAKSAFFREVGIALTHLLRPLAALQFFDLARGESTKDSTQQAYILCHEITALLELGRIQEAIQSLEVCKRIARALAEDFERKSLTERISAREAAIHFAQGEFHQVEPEMAKLAATGLVTYSGERAIFYIDAYLSTFPNGSQDIVELGRILMILEQARNDSLRKGFEHERIRLDIRRARIYQLLGIPTVAVPVLERVGIELGNFGGSEMALREFQMSSAQTLALLGKPAYAFSAYAWPAFNAINKDQVPVRWDAARKLCVHLMEIYKSDEALGNQNENPFREYVEELSNGPEHPFFSFDLLPPIPEVENCFRQFQSTEGRAAFMRLLG